MCACRLNNLSLTIFRLSGGAAVSPRIFNSSGIEMQRGNKRLPERKGGMRKVNISTEFEPKPMAFWVRAKVQQERPAFGDVVNRLYHEYARYRGNIVGKTLDAPDGATTRQISLALARVREKWGARRRGSGSRKDWRVAS
jgi:hypothetical protein